MATAGKHLATPDDARCKSCGYALRDLETTRCPECGREFDPADATTMHLGQPAGWFGRFLLRPPSAIPIVLCCAAAVSLVVISRYPLLKPQASWAELKYYFHSGISGRLVTPGDLVFVGAVALVCLSLIYLTIRFFARWAASRYFHYPAEPPVHLGRRAAILSLAVAASAMAAAFSWPYRFSKIWIRLWGDQLKASAASPRWMFLRSAPTGPPTALSTTELEEVLRSAVIELPTIAERTTALNLLMTNYESIAPPILLSAIAVEKDSKLRAMEIGLIGLYGDPKYVPDLLALLKDRDPSVRAAAIDAISIIYWPAYGIPNQLSGYTDVTLATNPPVPLPHVSGYGTFYGGAPKVERNTIPDDLLARLKKLAFHGTTTQDREAAARAIFKWQGSPKFRVAEWGVWIAGTSGNFQMLKSVLDEIPPFVHQTGDRVEADSSYLSMPDSITKPIIHISAEQPLVLDLAVLINGGRPWYVYPLPDDYTVTSGRHDLAFAKTYNPSLEKLPEPRRGYKWISPPHDTASILTWSGIGPLVIDSIGVRWQTLFVNPQKLDWMLPPNVPTDDRYAWWSRLRRVPSCWVSSRGEAERFLYYDGPTTCPSKWIATLEADHLTAEIQPGKRTGFHTAGWGIRSALKLQ